MVESLLGWPRPLWRAFGGDATADRRDKMPESRKWMVDTLTYTVLVMVLIGLVAWMFGR